MITKKQLSEVMQLHRSADYREPTWAVLYGLLLEALSQVERDVMNIVSEKESITSGELGMVLAIRQNNASNCLKRLVDWGILEREEVEGVNHYFIDRKCKKHTPYPL